MLILALGIQGFLQLGIIVHVADCLPNPARESKSKRHASKIRRLRTTEGNEVLGHFGYGEAIYLGSFIIQIAESGSTFGTVLRLCR